MLTPSKNCCLAAPPRRCLVDLSSSNCSKCLNHGLKNCNLVVLEANWRRLDSLRAKLCTKKDAACAALSAAAAASSAAAAKLTRLDH
jgi:hypothetical protein